MRVSHERWPQTGKELRGGGNGEYCIGMSLCPEYGKEKNKLRSNTLREEPGI